MSQRFTLYNDLTVGGKPRFHGLPPQARPGRLSRSAAQGALRLISFDRSIETLGARTFRAASSSRCRSPRRCCTTPRSFSWTSPRPASRRPRAPLLALIRDRRRGKNRFRDDPLHGRGRAVRPHRADAHGQAHRAGYARRASRRRLFPMPITSSSPRGALSFQEIARWRTDPLFSFFEPYGLRFHAAVHDGGAWERSRGELEQRLSRSA